MAAPRTELPPTAGLPLHWRDFVPTAAPSLARSLARVLELDDDAATLTCSGTAALVLALNALKRVSARREVIVPAYTCPLLAIAVAHCGLALRVCDNVAAAHIVGATPTARRPARPATWASSASPPAKA